MTSNNKRNITYNPLEKLKNKGSGTTGRMLPKMLSEKTTGMDVFPIKRDKLIPAPESWNFYAPLNETKMTELIESIQNKGLLHPIVVWEQSDETYMILSGHNRNAAFEFLYNHYKDESTEAEKYETIHAHIFNKDELDEEDAKQIIIDTNWVTRQLSPMEKQKSIFNKYTSMGRKERATNGESVGSRNRDFLAAQYSITGRQISTYIKLNYLIPEFKGMVDNTKISITSGVVLASFKEDLQYLIYEKYGEEINNNIVKKMNSNMTIEDISELFTPTNTECANETYFKTEVLTIPESLKEKYKKYMLKFFKDNNLLSENKKEFMNKLIKEEIDTK